MGIHFGVGNTAHKVSGAYIGIGGVAHKVSKGYVGVGGVAHEFWSSAGGPPIPVTITGKGNLDKCCVTIGDTTYSGSTSGIEVVPGSTILLRVYGTVNTIGGIPSAQIIIDGATVATTRYREYADFAWEVPSGISAINIAFNYQTINSSAITVTTT